MEGCSAISLVWASVLIFFLTALYLMIKLYSCKAIGNTDYPPVKGIVFGLIRHFSDLYDYLTRLAKDKATFRLLAIGHDEVYTIDPLNIEHTLKTNFGNYSKGKYLKDILFDLFGDGIFAADGEKWKQQRRLASVEFSTRVLRDYSCVIFRQKSAKLVRKVMEFVDSGGAFDVQDLLMRYTLDSIFHVGFGVQLNCLDKSSEEGTKFMSSFDESQALVFKRFIDPFWKIKRFLNVGSEAKLKKNAKFVHDYVHELIAERKKVLATQKESVLKEDILSRFLAESEKDPITMNNNYLKDIILNFMLAGKDTTANGLSWFLYMLCKNPLVQEKIVQEINDTIGSHENSIEIDEFVQSITDDCLDNMHYLHAALTETLRLYPSVPSNVRCADRDDVLPDGYRIKKGDDVNYIAYAMGRMTNLWGEDAEIYRPERWLKDGAFQPESQFKFVSFHAGPRICLGKDFAYRQMKIVAMASLRFFRFKLADETREVNYKPTITFPIDGGLYLHAVPRFSV